MEDAELECVANVIIARNNANARATPRKAEVSARKSDFKDFTKAKKNGRDSAKLIFQELLSNSANEIRERDKSFLVAACYITARAWIGVGLADASFVVIRL